MSRAKRAPASETHVSDSFAEGKNVGQSGAPASVTLRRRRDLRPVQFPGPTVDVMLTLFRSGLESLKHGDICTNTGMRSTEVTRALKTVLKFRYVYHYGERGGYALTHAGRALIEPFEKMRATGSTTPGKVVPAVRDDLNKMPLTRACEVVAGTFDKAMLREWRQIEERKPVIDSIDRQLGRLETAF